MYARLQRSTTIRAGNVLERVLYPAEVALLVLVGYYAGTRIGLALTFPPNPISVLWPPNAILLSAMILVPANLWWVVVLAALPAHLLGELQGGVPTSMVLCWFISNVAEAAMGAACLRILLRDRLTFGSVVHVAAFLSAAFAAVFLSSFLDSAFVVLNRWGNSDYWSLWRTRVIANMTTALTVVPAIVTWHAVRFEQIRIVPRIRFAEAAALVMALLVVTLAVFDSRVATAVTPALICLPLPLLLWAALRFGPLGASTSFTIVAVIVVWGTGHGLGPLGTGLPAANALSVQLFLIFVGPTLLCLAAALAERRNAERSLQASDRRFQLVLRATNDGVYERDLASDAMWWSANGLAQFGYADDACPATFAAASALVHPDDREGTFRSHAAAIEGAGTLWESEYRLRRADGSFAHVHEKGLLVRDGRGRATQMIAALTDVTERRDNDELSQRLAHASRLTAMGELTASIAHEINQPMSAILSNVDAAEMLLDAAGHVDDELRQILVDIRNDDLRASEVIRHIRGIANKRAIDVSAFDINDLFRAVLRLASPTLRRRGVSVVTELDDVPLVRGDRIHVQQVLLNLVFNAADAMAGTRESDRRLHVSTYESEPEMVLVCVRDRGHGIPPEQVNRIFDSFYTTKKDGLGLGLSIARSLVEAQGGSIWAENNSGGGATVRFTLPMQPVDRGAAPAGKR